MVDGIKSSVTLLEADGDPVDLSISAEDIGDPVEPITLEEAKKQCRVELPDDDEYILSLITVARQMAEGRLNRTIVQRQLEVSFDAWGTGLRIPKPPLLSVDEIEYVGSDGETAILDDESYRVSKNIEPARISAAYGYSFPALQSQSGAVVVRYTAGYEAGKVPTPIVQWMKLVIATLYSQRENMVVGVSAAMIPEEFNSWLLQPYMVYE